MFVLSITCHHNTSAADMNQLPASVFEPTFVTTEGDLEAGKVFVATLPTCKEALLVSALHLFGPAGGMSKQSTGNQIADLVKHISLIDISGKTKISQFKARSLTPANAACCSNKADTAVGDVVAFAAPEAMRDLALPISTRLMKKGDKVFVLSSVASPGVKRLSHAAVVEGMNSGYWTYLYSEPGFVIRATSGAPVVNEAGEVVAINLGGGSKAGSDKIMGYGNPAANWSPAIASMCQR
ncbi:hypothetical protein ACO0K9_18395 [Undibacterium sp. Ji50W]|uniref:hypothetical protein n=1 Tax=Undibacterium sp. Ji50W TaxID=3413041 RepID=UPI003BEF587B